MQNQPPRVNVVAVSVGLFACFVTVIAGYLDLGVFNCFSRSGFADRAARRHFQRLGSLAGVSQYRNFTVQLWLDGKLAKTTEADLLKLKDLKELRRLEMTNLEITNKTALAIASLRELRTIILVGDKIEETALTKIASMPTLLSLKISRTPISHKTLCELARVAHEEPWRLNLSNSNIDDEAIACIAKFNKNISDLDVSNTLVTDCAIKALSSMRDVGWIRVDETLMTTEGVPELVRLRPETHVWFDETIETSSRPERNAEDRPEGSANAP